MKRLLRWLFNALTLSLLLFCAVAVVFWVRSYRPTINDHYALVRLEPRQSVGIISAPGAVFCIRGPASVLHQLGGDFAWERLFPGLRVSQLGSLPPTQMVLVDYWLLVTAWGVVPVFRIFRWLLGKKKWPAGMCAVCGYDLRATVDRCPECGAVS